MKIKRNWWPVGIIMAFVLFFIGMASVIVIAAAHREHLVNANYYEQEIKFQGQIDAAARAQKSGATLACDLAASKIVITLPAGLLSNAFSGTVEFYRPSAPELDRILMLEPEPDGVQSLSISGLASGPWLARVKWTAAGEDYFIEQKFTVAGK